MSDTFNIKIEEQAPIKVTITQPDTIQVNVQGIIATHPDTVDAIAKSSASAAAASASQTNAANSATSATASQAASATSETNSAASAASANTSKISAATSETNSASSASSALASKNASATSETNSAVSASAANTSKLNAATSETNSAASATSALASKNAAATSETNSASSASSALASKNAAATSEANTANAVNTAFTNPSIVDPTRLDAKKGTLAAHQTYASTATNGQLVYATDTKQLFQVLDGALAPVGGGGGGGSDTIAFLDASENLTDWTTGNNATFLGAGTLAGTFAKETASPLNGSASYKYTQVAGSLNDYISTKALSVAKRFRGTTVSLVHPFTYDGGANDIQVIFYDVTNSAVIPSSTFVPVATSNSIFKTNITIPLTCTSLRIGYQVKAANAGKVFIFDDVELTSDATVYADLFLPAVVYEGYGAATSTPTTAHVDLPIGSVVVDNTSILVNSTTLKIPRNGNYNINTVVSTGPSTGTKNCYITVNGTNAYIVPGTGVGAYSGIIGQLTVPLKRNDLITVRAVNQSSAADNWNVSSVSLTSVPETSPNILSSPDTFNSDTAPFVFAPSASFTFDTLQNSRVGTYITFVYNLNANTKIQAISARPDQTDADMNQNGILIYTRAINAASTTGQPTAVAIQIGKGYKGYELAGFFGAGSTQDVSLVRGVITSALEEGVDEFYNPVTGVLFLTAGYARNGSTTTRRFLDAANDLGRASAYIKINASKFPTLTGTNVASVVEIRENRAATSIGTTQMVVPYATVIKSTHSMWDGTKFVISDTGTYSVKLIWNTVQSGVDRPVEVLLIKTASGGAVTVSGQTITRIPLVASGSGAYGDRFGVNIATDIDFIAGNSFEVRATSPFGATPMNGGEGANRISIVKVG